MGISKNMNVHVEQVSGSTLRCIVLFFLDCFVPTGVTCEERDSGSLGAEEESGLLGVKEDSR
jgi:hypothetical protein